MCVSNVFFSIPIRNSIVRFVRSIHSLSLRISLEYVFVCCCLFFPSCFFTLAWPLFSSSSSFFLTIFAWMLCSKCFSVLAKRAKGNTWCALCIPLQSLVLHSIIQIDRCTGHYSRLRLRCIHTLLYMNVAHFTTLLTLSHYSSTNCIFLFVLLLLFVFFDALLSFCCFALLCSSISLRLCWFRSLFFLSVFCSVLKLNWNCTNSLNTHSSLSFITFIQYDWREMRAYVDEVHIFCWLLAIWRSVAMAEESLVADCLMISTSKNFDALKCVQCCICAFRSLVHSLVKRSNT